MRNASWVFLDCHLHLPSPNSKHVRFVKQGVTITGLGLDDFQSQLDMIPDVVSLFTWAIDENKIEPNTIIGEHKELPTLHASNRYFTPKKDACDAEELVFHKDVDPSGNLKRLLGPNQVHIEENVVSYYERVGTESTKYSSRLSRVHWLNFLSVQIYCHQAGIRQRG